MAEVIGTMTETMSSALNVATKGHTRDMCWIVIGYPSWHSKSLQFPQKPEEGTTMSRRIPRRIIKVKDGISLEEVFREARMPMLLLFQTLEVLRVPLW